MAGAADNFFGKNKGRTIEAKLVKLTKVAAVIFFVLSLIASLLVLFGA
ncbi:MAG: preprotein translocase subunit SecG [Acutalibacteraceae bacterium]